MKILLVSDSHCMLSALDRAAGAAKGVDMFIHLGDHSADGDYLKTKLNVPGRIVRGNCDFSGPYPLEELLEIAGARVFITHGHTYGVKNSIVALTEKAAGLNADAAFFGHTHTPFESMEGGVLVLNPGSVARSPVGRSTYALIEIDNGKIISKIHKL